MKNTKKIISGILIITLLVSIITITDKKEIEAFTRKECEWNIECINAQNSYEDSKKCSRIKVAVLDSGLDYDDDIACVEQKDFLGEEEINGIYQDLTGHGTCISGIICSDENSSRITGIASNVDLYMARVLDEDNKADINRVVEAIKWAIEKKVQIIHMSFGIKTYSKALNDVVQEAYNKGILLIAAAGNGGTADENESTVEYPAALDNVIAVGCTNEQNKKADFSSSGSELDVVAPGEKILSTGCFGGVVVEEGTSLAAAQVTGVAAVLWGMHSEKSNTYIREWIISSANETTGDDCGNGMLDYEKAKKNYSKMEQHYQKNKAKGYSETKSVTASANKLPENQTKIDTHKVEYVTGMWGKDVHQSFMYEKKKSLIPNAYITLMKKALYMADKISKIKGMGSHPCFHGKGNYIANTQYLFRMYYEFIKASKIEANKKKDNKNGITNNIIINSGDTAVEWLDYQTVYEGNSELYNDEEGNNKNIKEELENAEKSIYRSILGKKASQWTNDKKAYVMLGLAIHNATDAFSHSVYKKIKIGNKSEWWKLEHDFTKSNAKKKTASHIWKAASVSNSKFKKLYEEVAVCDKIGKLKPLHIAATSLAHSIIGKAMNKDKECYKIFLDIAKHYKSIQNSKRYKVRNYNTYLKLVGLGRKENKNYCIGYEKGISEVTLPQSIKVTVKKHSISVSVSYKAKHMDAVWIKNGNKKIFLKQGKQKKKKIKFSLKNKKINFKKCKVVNIHIVKHDDYVSGEYKKKNKKWILKSKKKKGKK